MHILLLSGWKKHGKDHLCQHLQNIFQHYPQKPPRCHENEIWHVYHRSNPQIDLKHLHPNLEVTPPIQTHRVAFADPLKIKTYKRLGFMSDEESNDTLPTYDTKHWFFMVLYRLLFITIFENIWPTWEQFVSILHNLWFVICHFRTKVLESEWKDRLMVPYFDTEHNLNIILLRDAFICVAREELEIDPDVFCTLLLQHCERLKIEQDTKSIVIPDHRFFNEMQSFQDPIVTARVFRKSAIVPNHSIVSEHALDELETDWLITDSIEAFQDCVQLLPQYRSFRYVGAFS